VPDGPRNINRITFYGTIKPLVIVLDGVRNTNVGFKLKKRWSGLLLDGGTILWFDCLLETLFGDELSTQARSGRAAEECKTIKKAKPFAQCETEETTNL
jgi:hypothetical protein